MCHKKVRGVNSFLQEIIYEIDQKQKLGENDGVMTTAEATSKTAPWVDPTSDALDTIALNIVNIEDTSASPTAIVDKLWNALGILERGLGEGTFNQHLASVAHICTKIEERASIFDKNHAARFENKATPHILDSRAKIMHAEVLCALGEILQAKGKLSKAAESLGRVTNSTQIHPSITARLRKTKELLELCETSPDKKPALPLPIQVQELAEVISVR